MKKKLILGVITLPILLQGCQISTEATTIVDAPQQSSTTISVQSNNTSETNLVANKTLDLTGRFSLFNLISFNSNTIQPYTIINKHNVKYGFINTETGTIMDPKFDSINQFMVIDENTTLLPVCIKRKWGYISKTGEEMIPLKYDSARPFTGDYAVVESGGKVGLINKKGEVIIPFKYTDIYNTVDDLFILVNQKGDYSKFGLYNAKTKKTVAPKYNTDLMFLDGYALAGTSETSHDLINENGDVIKTYKYSDVIMGRDYTDIIHHNKKANNYIIYRKGEKFGADVIKDNTAQPFVKPIYNSLYMKEDKLYYNKFSNDGSYFHENGYITSDKKEHVFETPDEMPLVNGLQGFYYSKPNYGETFFGYKDANNKIVIPAKYISGHDFTKQGYAIVQDNKGKMALINKTGKEVFKDYFISPLESYNDKTMNDRFYIGSSQDTQSMNLYDTNTNKIISRGYENYIITDNKYIMVNRSGKTGLLDLTGKVIVQPRDLFDYEEFKLGYLLESPSSRNMYLTDLNGKRLHKTAYNHIGFPNKYNQRVVQINKNYYLADKKGNLIHDQGYTHILPVNEKQFIGITSVQDITTISVINI